MPLLSRRRKRFFYSTTAVLFAFLAPQILAKNNPEVIVVPVANMYSHPSDKSDVVSQAIYGSNVTLLVARGEWSRIQTSDRYRGWVPSRHLRILLTGNGYAMQGPTVQVDSLFANIYKEPDVTKHKPVVTVPFETRLEVIADEASDAKGVKVKNDAMHATKGSVKIAVKEVSPEGWLRVHLPDLQTAWIQSSDVVSDPKPMSIPESVELAKRFLGIPYLWGGRSSFGFDCSGFTQMLVRARGMNMPRDADQQASWIGVTSVERKDLQAGDLLFFGASPKEISHTGMYIGDGQFIHDSTNGPPVVQISRLDEEPWTKILVACRRVK